MTSFVIVITIINKISKIGANYKQLQNNYKTITKQLQNNYKSILNYNFYIFCLKIVIEMVLKTFNLYEFIWIYMNLYEFVWLSTLKQFQQIIKAFFRIKQ
jgi:hypothetical protein